MDKIGTWLGVTGFLLTGYQLLLLVPALVALRSVRIHMAARTVALTCIDVDAMIWVGGILCGALPLVWLVFDGGLVVGGAIALVLWFGFRVELRATPGSTWLIRKFLYVIPWYVKRYREVPRAFTDGWGEDELYLSCGQSSSPLWVGSEHRYSRDSCPVLAARFNQAIEEINNVSNGHP